MKAVLTVSFFVKKKKEKNLSRIRKGVVNHFSTSLRGAILETIEFLLLAKGKVSSLL